MTTIHLHGIVGLEITPSRVREQIAGAGDLDIRLHSPGGDVHDGIAVHNLLRDHRRAGHRVTVTVAGLAASIATYIAMSADEIRVEDNAVLMVHNPWAYAIGDYRDMEKAGGILAGLARVLANTYATRTGQTLTAIRQAMDEEIWLYGEDIVAAGWADALIPSGDGPKTADAALALARTAFSAMRRTLQDRADAPSLDRIAALLPLNQIEATPMSKQTPVANAQEPLIATQPPEPTGEAKADDDGTDSAQPSTASADPVEARIQAAIAAERQRVAAIQSRCAQVGKPELAAALIASGATLADCHAAIVDAWVAQGGFEIRQTTSGYTPAETADWSDVIAKINARRA